MLESNVYFVSVSRRIVFSVSFVLWIFFCSEENCTHPKSVIFWCCHYHYHRRADVCVSRLEFRDLGMWCPFQRPRPSFVSQKPWKLCFCRWSELIIFSFFASFFLISCLIFNSVDSTINFLIILLMSWNLRDFTLNRKCSRFFLTTEFFFELF